MPPKAVKPPQVKDERLDHAYSIMQSAENRLGGGEGVEGIYGSITRTGMQRIFDSMRHNCGLDNNSVLVDVGAGLGRPLLHALVNPGIKSAFGIELDHVKVAKASAFLEQTLAELAKRGHVAAHMGRPAIHCTSIEQVPNFGSATHAYSFWEGIPVSGRAAFGRLFAASKSLKCVAVVQRAIRNQHPAQLMASYGFGPLLLIANFAVQMSGSGASFQAYIFSKIPSATAAFMDQVLAGSTHPATHPVTAKGAQPADPVKLKAQPAAGTAAVGVVEVTVQDEVQAGTAQVPIVLSESEEVPGAERRSKAKPQVAQQEAVQEVQPPLKDVPANVQRAPPPTNTTSGGGVSPRDKQANLLKFGRQTKQPALRAGPQPSKKAIGKDVRGKDGALSKVASEALPVEPVRRSSRLRSQAAV